MYGRRKYGNKIIETPEGRFDGKQEWLRYKFLKDAERTGGISNLARQVEFILIPRQAHTEVEHLKTKDRIKEVFDEHPVRYVADFVYEKDGETVVEDFKGLPTPEYIIKRKLMLYMKGIRIREVKKPGEPV